MNNRYNLGFLMFWRSRKAATLLAAAKTQEKLQQGQFHLLAMCP
ncbi:hypothetical protein [Fischerella sp. PCC 9605]|nr:hypothetical protein [Fischerella sp. PCC 9605]